MVTSEPPTAVPLSDCPGDEVLWRWVSEALGADQAAQTASHVERCIECSKVVSVVLRLEGPDTGAGVNPGADWVPSAGERVGSWVLLERLGQGAMGAVFAAWDTKLQRRIAVKWVRGDDTADAAQRLWGEAQTLARLAHPNVVRVFDAGTHRGRTWVAMEWISGCTLRQFLLARPRWQTTFRLVLQAARGLSAAHRAGIVHRDVKPENVLVDDTEQALVSDFGLATRPQQRTSEVAGTFAYMAPEQREGRSDDRADQYALAMLAWEALYGVRPRNGVVTSTPSTPVGALPASSRAPTRFQSVLERALKNDPAARFPSMDALVTALEQMERRPQRWLTRGAAAALLVGTAAAAATAWTTWSACDGGADAWAAWDTPARTAVRQAHPSAEAFLRAYGVRWVTAYQGICKATRVSRTQTDERMMDRLECLARQRDIAGAILDEVTPRVTDESLVDGLQTLVAPEDCTRIEPVVHRAVAGSQHQLQIERVEAALSLGESERAETLLRELEGQKSLLIAEGMWSRVLNARYRVMANSFTGTVEEEEANERQAAEALRFAVAEGDDDVAFTASVSLAEEAAMVRLDFKESARRYAEAESYLVRLGASSGSALSLLISRCLSSIKARDFKGARADLEHARELWQLQKGDETAELDLHSLEATLGYAMEDMLVAAPAAEKAYRLALKMYGADHRTTLDREQVLARTMTVTDRLDEAEAHTRHVVETLRTLNADPTTLGLTLADLSDIQVARKEFEPAVVTGREALRLLLEGGLEEHIANAERIVGAAERQVGRRDEALRLFRSAVARVQKIDGPNAVSTAPFRRELLIELTDQQHLDEAETLYRELRAIDVAAGSPPLMLALDDSAGSAVLWRRGRKVEALEMVKASRAQVAKDDPHSFRLKTLDETIATWEAALAKRRP